MFLSLITRPDISHALSYLSQFNNNHDEIHWKSAKRALKYLKKTANYRLTYQKGNDGIAGFEDADWGNNLFDRKSYTGFCYKLLAGIVSWESSKQKTIALSSTEAEYMAIADASKEAIYLRKLLSEFTDNLVCIMITKVRKNV